MTPCWLPKVACGHAYFETGGQTALSFSNVEASFNRESVQAVTPGVTPNPTPVKVRPHSNRSGRFAVAGLLALLPVPDAVANLQNYPFSYEVLEDGKHTAIAVRNNGPAVISARLAVTGTNIEVDRASPIDVVVPGYSTQRLVRFWQAAPGATAQITYRSSHHFGDTRARHDPSTLYRLPFEDGKTFPVAQSYGGTLTTHAGEQDQYAIDIAMPEGTPVVAARDGIVVNVTVEHVAGAADPKLLDLANSITILHGDGTIAVYAHLAQRTAIVKRGQRVAAGDRIGFSGNTGYSSGPHLHFAVSRPVVNAEGIMQQFALPVTFYMHDPPVPVVLRQGMSVTATYGVASPNPDSSIHAQSPSPVERDANAASTRTATPAQPVSAGLYLEFMRERSGLPTWGWLIVLLGIWLAHRSRRRADERLRREPRTSAVRTGIRRDRNTD